MSVQFSDKISLLKPSAIREILKMTADPSVISFAAGNPAAESFPVDEMRAIADRLLTENPAAALQYSVTEGYAPLIRLVEKRLKERFSVGRDFDQTIIVTGGQQGIELSCKVLCNEGDTVLCENPSFIGALNAFRSYNTRLKGIPVDEDGINIEALESAMKTERNVKMLYVIPTFQNPTGKTMSLTKRREVYDLAKKYGVIILEDNPYGELRFKGEDVPSIKSLDTDGIVIYCGSFSKIFSPGIRVGFVCAPAEITQKIVVAKQVSDVHTNIFFQMMLARYLSEYDINTHIRGIQQLYRGKCELMLSLMDKHFDSRISYTRPDGGIFLWCTMPEGTDIVALAKTAVENKVAIVPGFTFMANESDPCWSFRMNYSMPSDEQIETGVALLGRIIKGFMG